MSELTEVVDMYCVNFDNFVITFFFLEKNSEEFPVFPLLNMCILIF